jgi:hypothetical protein
MRFRTLSKIPLFFAIATTLAACGAVPSIGTASPPPPQATPTLPPRSGPLCANSLLPVKEGATWTYDNTSGGADQGLFTATITEVRSDGFTVATTVDNAEVDHEWACKPEGLMAKSLGTGQSPLTISADSINATVATSDASGVTIPYNVQPGMKWPYGIHLSGTLSQADISADVRGALSTSFEAVGTEQVTVPAGTFTAMKVQSSSTIKVDAGFRGLMLPITSVVNATFWFAPGVGWIKSEETGELAGTAVSATTQLQSYSIP